MNPLRYMFQTISAASLFFVVSSCGLDTSEIQHQQTEIKSKSAVRDSGILSAYFGVDNAPLGANVQGCLAGKTSADAMPVTFKKELNPATLQTSDFRVIQKSGKIGSVWCTTLLPATDKGEWRTVVLLGDFGDATLDPPAKVEIVGQLLSKDLTTSYQGASVKVTPLDAGPFAVLAEVSPVSEWKLGETEPSQGGTKGTGCPLGTKQVVRVVWSGGVTKPGGQEVDMQEGALYKVLLETQDGKKIEVTPFAIGDLYDGDNNHLLCLKEKGIPLRVSFPAGYFTDPNEDATNSAADIAVISNK